MLLVRTNNGATAMYPVRRMGLGYVDDNAVEAMSMPTGAMARRPDVHPLIRAAVDSRFNIPFDPSQFSCSANARPVGAMLTSTAGGTMLKLAPAAGPAAPLVAIGGAIMSVFSHIFNHHAQAVARERNVLCNAIPAAIDAIGAIRQAMADGTITTQQARDGLDALFRDFDSAVAPIRKDCNAACIVTWQLRAGINSIKRDADYKDEQDQAAAAAAEQAAAAQRQAQEAQARAAAEQAKAQAATQKAAQPKALPGAPGAPAAAPAPLGLPWWAIPAAVGAAALLLL